jgi:hypothetical protein
MNVIRPTLGRLVVTSTKGTRKAFGLISALQIDPLNGIRVRMRLTGIWVGIEGTRVEVVDPQRYKSGQVLSEN